MKLRSEIKLLSIALITTLLSVPMLSSAAVNTSPQTDHSMTLNISDLDLSQDQGIETLYARLKTNVKKVCGVKQTHVVGSRTTSAKVERFQRKCSAESLERAVQTINLEKLTNLHRESQS